MRNVARGSALLFLVAMVVGVFFFAQPKAEAVTILAKDSQENIQKLNNTEIKLNTDDKNIESFEINFEAEAAASSGNKARAFKATAYCLRGKTASGRMVRRGIVAADPRVLPLGTRIRLSGGRYSGNYVVADTGGKIKGRILDIWVPSCAEARRWGRRTVKVSVIGKAKRKSKKRRRG
jgi:3D (Asp-Asp-Asp) domain-containing protein